MAAIARIRRNTIGDVVHRAASQHRDKVALSFADRDWSFRDIDAAVGRLAHALHRLGLRRGERVAAYGRNSDTYLLLFLACARAGMIHVPVNYALTGAELGYVLHQSGAALFVHDTALADQIGPAREAPLLRHIGCFAGGGGFDVLAIARDPAIPGEFDTDNADTDIAQIVYTSGTTAAPKGAAMTHQAMIAQYHSCIHGLGYGPEDRHIAALPLYHTAQMHAFLMPAFMTGAWQKLLMAPQPELVLAAIEEHRASSFFAPPTVWIGLLRHADFDRRDLSSLRRIYYGASIMPVPVLQELRTRLPGAAPYNCYGQTEIAPVATILAPADHDARPGSVGKPVLNVETRVVDLAMNDVPPGAHGEIVHRSPHLLVGYWEKPDATEEVFAGGWFHSGDVGTFDADGFLYIVDRIKDVINTGGVLVASRDVEEALFTHPAVSEVAVIALPDPKWIEAITAVVVLRPGAVADQAALIAHAAAHLAPFKRPKRIIFAEDLPRNTAGKLLKRELRRIHAGAAAPWGGAPA
ncbi:MAG: AMP-binding protein [Rhodospirillales bacterium]|nr:AMP-binding protein [Rhodospirillales bacterium]